MTKIFDCIYELKSATEDWLNWQSELLDFTGIEELRDRIKLRIDKFGDNVEQGHHHNGDHAARRPHMMRSICVRRFTTPLFGDTYGSG